MTIETTAAEARQAMLAAHAVHQRALARSTEARERRPTRALSDTLWHAEQSAFDAFIEAHDRYRRILATA